MDEEVDEETERGEEEEGEDGERWPGTSSLNMTS